MRILIASTFDIGGGAAAVAWNLFDGYRRRGHRAWLAVGSKRGDDGDVLVLPNDVERNPWAGIWTGAGDLLAPLAGKVAGADWLRRTLQIPLAHPRRWLEIRQGKEDFHFPGTWQLLSMAPERPDLVHCHNLHGGYFDLRALPWLSRRVPVFLTLHDTWLLSGHCAYSLDCERWMQGCGRCPDLTIYPAVLRDATAYNWRRKRDIYARSKLYVAAPCAWLMQDVERSMLAPGIVEARIIPYGIDLSTFRPADRRVVRARLDIPRDASVLLFAANRVRLNPFKDYPTIQATVGRVAESLPGRDVLFIALGDDGPPERIGQAEVRFIPYQTDPTAVAAYYQAADVFLHAAHADTFPNTVLEALACGTPVVATAVGGIPEQVKGLALAQSGALRSRLNHHGQDDATGVLVPHGDAQSMAEAVMALLTDEALRCQLGENAARDARLRFDLDRQVEEYLRWYAAVLERQHAARSPGELNHRSTAPEQRLVGRTPH